MLAKVILTMLCAAILSSCAMLKPEIPAESPTAYVSWGVDEYEFFGLTKEEIQKKFKGDLHFNENVTTASFNEAKNECKSFVGPTFRLTYQDGKVQTVQRCFEACNKQFIGPVFINKKEALQFAIKGLTGTKNAKDQEKLAAAKNALATIK